MRTPWQGPDGVPLIKRLFELNIECYVLLSNLKDDLRVCDDFAWRLRAQQQRLVQWGNISGLRGQQDLLAGELQLSLTLITRILAQNLSPFENVETLSQKYGIQAIGFKYNRRGSWGLVNPFTSAGELITEVLRSLLANSAQGMVRLEIGIEKVLLMGEGSAWKSVDSRKSFELIELLEKGNDDLWQLVPLEISNISPPSDFKIPIQMPMQRSLDFSGEDNLLERVHESLNPVSVNGRPLARTRRTAILYGLDSARKVQQLSVEYAYRYSSLYTSVFWVDAISQTSLARSIATMAEQIFAHYSTEREDPNLDFSQISTILHLPKFANRSRKLRPDVITLWVRRWLGTPENKGWLIISNDYNGNSVRLCDLLPNCNFGSLIITRKSTFWNLVGFMNMRTGSISDFFVSGREFPEEAEKSDDKQPFSALKNDERVKEIHQPNKQVSDIQEKLPRKYQNITGQTAKKLRDMSLRIRYMISRWEFNIIWVLTKHRNNKISSRRVGWKCVCGADLSDDFQELSDHNLEPTRRWELRQNERFRNLDKRELKFGWLPTIFSMGRNIRARSGIPSNPFGRFQSASTRISNLLPTPQVRSSSRTQIPNLPSGQQTANIPSSPQQPTPTPSDDQYLFLCFNDESFLGQKSINLLHLDIPASMNDQTLFATIREAYYTNRGWYKCVLSLKVLARVDFVKFELFYLENVEIRNSCDMPPETNTDYEYDPKPAEMIPPIGGFMHFFHNPKCAPIDDELLSAMPRKKNGRLTHKSKGRKLGWGIHFIEEPSWTRVWLLVGLFCGGLMTYAIWWTRVTGDMQGGFGVAAFIAAIGAIIIPVASLQVAY